MSTLEVIRYGEVAKMQMDAELWSTYVGNGYNLFESVRQVVMFQLMFMIRAGTHLSTCEPIGDGRDALHIGTRKASHEITKLLSS